MARVGIVTAMGRGEWLAHACHQQGLDVFVVDLSHLFPWSQEAWEGPFPWVQTDALRGEYWPWLERHFNLEESKTGWTLLTEKGPLEMKSAPCEHRLQQLGVNTSVLTNNDLGHQLDFAETWPLRSFQLGLGADEIPPAQKNIHPVAGSLQDALYFIRSRPESFSRLDPNISVYKGYDVEDIAVLQKNKIQGLLIKKERSELLALDRLVWCLSSAETQFLSASLSEKLFGGEVRESSYFWASYQAVLTGTEHLPSFFVWMEDPELPWAHTNFMVFKRQKSSQFQIWMKIPTHQRFFTTALQEEEAKWTQALQKRMNVKEILITQRPLETEGTYKSLGPPVFATYKEGILNRSLEVSGGAIHFVSPELARGNAPHCLAMNEIAVEAQISKWWKQEQELIAKKKMRENTRS